METMFCCQKGLYHSQYYISLRMKSGHKKKKKRRRRSMRKGEENKLTFVFIFHNVSDLKEAI